MDNHLSGARFQTRDFPAWLFLPLSLRANGLLTSLFVDTTSGDCSYIISRHSWSRTQYRSWAREPRLLLHSCATLTRQPCLTYRLVSLFVYESANSVAAPDSAPAGIFGSHKNKFGPFGSKTVINGRSRLKSRIRINFLFSRRPFLSKKRWTKIVIIEYIFRHFFFFYELNR